MNSADLISAFKTHLRAERGLAETTVQSYERMLQQFFRALGKSPVEAQREDLRDFLATLNPQLGDWPENMQPIYGTGLREQHALRIPSSQKQGGEP